MRVLVCGGRDYQDSSKVFETLGQLSDVSYIIEGGATGADHLGWLWATRNAIPILTFKAEWKKYGPAAGFIRNQQMLDEGKPDLVVAFPGGKGTANMVRIAKRSNVKVLEISD